MIRKDILICTVPLVLTMLIFTLYSNDVHKRFLEDFTGCLIRAVHIGNRDLGNPIFICAMSGIFQLIRDLDIGFMRNIQISILYWHRFYVHSSASSTIIQRLLQMRSKMAKNDCIFLTKASRL